MGMREMDELRRKLRLEHEGRIRVAFVYPYQLPMFECVSCSETMLWTASKNWWSCPDCGYEVTPEEVLAISNQLASAVGRFKSDVSRKAGKGFWTWVSEKLFGRQKRLPHSSI